MEKIQVFGFFLMTLTIASYAQATENDFEAARLIDISQSYQWTGNEETTPTVTTLTFMVSSTGCTSEKDFTISDEMMGHTQRITLIRKIQDDCKGIPTETAVTFQINSLKLATTFPIVVRNPVLVTGMRHTPGELLHID